MLVFQFCDDVKQAMESAHHILECAGKLGCRIGKNINSLKLLDLSEELLHVGIVYFKLRGLTATF